MLLKQSLLTQGCQVKFCTGLSSLALNRALEVVYELRSSSFEGIFQSRRYASAPAVARMSPWKGEKERSPSATSCALRRDSGAEGTFGACRVGQ